MTEQVTKQTKKLEAKAAKKPKSAGAALVALTAALTAAFTAWQAGVAIPWTEVIGALVAMVPFAAAWLMAKLDDDPTT